MAREPKNTADDRCIVLDGVSKIYRRRHVDAMLLRDLLPGRAARKHGEEDEFLALSDVSFEVKQGEAVAVVGQNGGGKSTLLALLAGSLRPTRGVVSVRGRVAPILGLGVGFELDMTAQENAYLNASLLGVAHEEIDEALPTILEFADLGDFVDIPVRHYSSGMLARLGFAIAMHVERDILLVDEVLAVGDLEFQRRCLARVRELVEGGLTLMFATHDLEMVREMCSRTLWLRNGRLEKDDESGACVDAYQAFLGSG